MPDCNEWLRQFSTAESRLRLALNRVIRSRGERFAWLERRLAQVHPGVELRQKAQRLDDIEQRLVRNLRQRLAERRSHVLQLATQVRQHSPALQVAAARARLETARTAIAASITRRIESLSSKWALAAGTLGVVSPLATLQRGYAIVTDAAGTVTTDAATLKPGDRISARLRLGSVDARVERTHPPEDPEEQ